VTDLAPEEAVVTDELVLMMSSPGTKTPRAEIQPIDLRVAYNAERHLLSVNDVGGVLAHRVSARHLERLVRFESWLVCEKLAIAN
jgi:hypothetical protein